MEQATSGWAGLQDILTRGISAYAETQIARYDANDPTPRNRGSGDYSGPAGSPAFETLAETLGNPVNLLLLGIAAVLTVVLIKRL